MSELESLIKKTEQQIKAVENAIRVAANKRKPSWIVNGLRRTRVMQKIVDQLLADEGAKRQPTIDRLNRKLTSYQEQLDRQQKKAMSVKK